MPYIPHTADETKTMLSTIGLNQISDLFSEIPKELLIDQLKNVPEGLSALEATQFFQACAKQDECRLNFIGAGAYEHFIPAAVWEIATRGEFMTAYTPYQAEASQGSLQLIYEYQTMLATMMGMEVSNASMYDGASVLAESILMAARAKSRLSSYKVLLPTTLHPYYRQVAKAIVTMQGIELIEISYNATTGVTDLKALQEYANEEICALIIPQPNFFGMLEPIDELTDWAKQKNALSIAVVNPTAMALLKEPGSWGEQGVDIVCGEGQPLGIPLASGGPYFGFLCCKKEHVRQMPGRIVGRTVDREGRQGFVLTLQAREQHIRRAKATSNICTNQGLMVTAATIYMSLMGEAGLRQIASACAQNLQTLIADLTAIPGVKLAHTGYRFHEAVLSLPITPAVVLEQLAQHGIEGGFDLIHDYPEIPNGLLICVTETKTKADLSAFASQLKDILSKA